MEYYKLPQSDLTVSRIALGCMRISDKSVEEVEELVKTALDLGINFFDTANVYGLGASEEILGRALKDYANREEIVIATKVSGSMGKGPNKSGLSRKAI